MSRRDARKHAFALIYQIPFRQPFTAEMLEETYSIYMEGLEADAEELPNPPTKQDVIYIRRVTNGILDKLNELDTEIAGYLKRWQLERINRIDLAILRLAVYEMLNEADIPTAAAVNEAIELAKEYGSDESPAFVNGVLGGVYRDRLK